MFSWAHLGLVVGGGAIGTALRAGLTLLFGAAAGPLFVPIVNVVGAFALGMLLGRLSRRPATPRTRALERFAGAGVLGGFTTYSALAVEAADPALLALGVVGAVAGTAAAAAGLALARRRRAAS